MALEAKVVLEQQNRGRTDTVAASGPVSSMPPPTTSTSVNYSLSPGEQMLSSGAGALLVSLFMTPLDVVKIRLQTQERAWGKKCFMYSNGIMDHLCPKTNGDPPVRALHTVQEICNCKWYNRPKYFNGTFDAIVKIAKMEGISSLWSGLSPTLVLALPTTVIYFTTYEQLRDQMAKRRQIFHQNRGQFVSSDVPPWIPLTSGALSRVWAVTLVSPLELIRTKMQSQRMAFYQVRSCIRDLVRAKGLRGLWSGYTATLLRDVPFSALYWPLLEGTKTLISRNSSISVETSPFMVNFLSGAVAGTIASTITLPFDVIKTIKQIEIGDIDIMQAKKGHSKSNRSIASEVYRQHGFKGFFAGLAPRILKVAPACAIMISSYEFFKTFFHEQNKLLHQTFDSH